ncbi:hypothetical protein KEJ37_07705 [Candidatus Bathyarchaeota archaeon]|nr:hypothetical protein [Candidatus Bathyarchaeota archaeon]
MDSFKGFLKRIVESLNASGLDYMFTGALAVSYYGRARTTVDVDVIVAAVGRGWRERLISALQKAGLIVEEKKLGDALKSSYFIATFKDSKSPLTLDVILSKEKLAKRHGKILGLQTYYQTPEDLVLAKLRMIRATVPRERAIKDVEDVKAILKFTRVNLAVVKRKAVKEGTLEILEGIMTQEG